MLSHTEMSLSMVLTYPIRFVKSFVRQSNSSGINLDTNNPYLMANNAWV